MAEQPLPDPTPARDTHTEPVKTGYTATGGDEPIVPARDDEPHTEPVKTGYDVQGD